MDTLHIVKCGDIYQVYYNNREIECESLKAAVESNIFSKELKEYLHPLFREFNVVRVSVWGVGDWWWAEADVQQNNKLLLVEAGETVRPRVALVELFFATLITLRKEEGSVMEIIIEKRGSSYIVNGEERESLAGILGLSEEHAGKLQIIKEYFETLRIERLVAKYEGDILYVYLEPFVL